MKKKNKKITKTFIDGKVIENIPKATEDQKTIDDVEVLKELDQELKAIEAYSDWNRIYESLELSPFAEAVFGNLEFISHEKSLITLRGDIEKSAIPNNVLKEFEDACTKILKVKIVLKFETGSSDNSPENIKLQESNIKQSAAETSIEKDVEIQNIIKKYNGKIQKDSIKSID